MKKISTLLTFLCFIVLASSCNQQKSLQEYLVENSEKEAFMYGDIPVGLMFTPKENTSEEVKETAKSIQKINALFLKKTPQNDVVYETEKNALKSILKNDKYKSLTSLKMKGINLSIYYVGEADNINEMIAFGYSKEAGVGVARLLGNQMNPSKILNMIQEVKIDPSAINLSQLKAVFSKK